MFAPLFLLCITYPQTMKCVKDKKESSDISLHFGLTESLNSKIESLNPKNESLNPKIESLNPKNE